MTSNQSNTRIAIDYTAAYEQGAGIGRITREVVAALARLDQETRYRLFVAGATMQDLGQPLAPNFVWKPTRINPRWLARIWHRLHLPLHIEQFVGDIDLFHATDFVLPPIRSSTKTILTVHDLSFVHVPEAAPPSLINYLNRVVPVSCDHADHIIADSYATRDDLIALYGITPDKITVIWSGVEERFKQITSPETLTEVRNKYQIPQATCVLSVGTVQPRKNYSRVVRAIAKLRGQGHDIHLVIAGGKGWMEDELHRTIAETQMNTTVHLIGYVDDEDLPALYSLSDCFVAPSLYEGFGIPVIEAMACGTPVVTSNVSSLPEVAGDAAITVAPRNIDDLANAIFSILTDANIANDLVRKGLERAKEFTWERAARQLQSVYADVLAD